jgi:glycosyltransferase involved in cell wall biosynthesis
MKICIVTPGYLSSTPRVVREADALAAAGFAVRVVFTQGPIGHLRASDTEIVEASGWHASAVRWSGDRFSDRWRYLRSGARHYMARWLASRGLGFAGIEERAEGRIYPELARLAAQERADLYIGHYPTGLAAASAAASAHRTLLGYDVEDLYAETFPQAGAWLVESRRIRAIERRYVQACAHITAVSAAVAAEFARRYDVPAPLVVHNCHPWADRARLDRRRLERIDGGLSLFWFSQTVGLDRGLQDAITAAGLARCPVRLHLRGTASDDVRRELVGLAAANGMVDRVHFHPACPPRELLSRASEHDVGLALETSEAMNRCLTVTNKLFLYLTAGLAVAATDVPGQRGILETCPGAGVLHSPGDVRTLAGQLDRWSRDPAMLAGAKNAALDAARTRWNAETETSRLVAAVERLWAGPAPVAGVGQTMPSGSDPVGIDA